MKREFNLKILLLLSLGHMVTDIYQGALPAILPFLKDHLDLSYTAAGAILMAANFTSSLIQPVFGYLSDKKEKAFLLPLGCLMAGIGLTLLPLASVYFWTLVLVVVSRRIAGLRFLLYFLKTFQQTGLGIRTDYQRAAQRRFQACSRAR